MIDRPGSKFGPDPRVWMRFVTPAFTGIAIAAGIAVPAAMLEAQSSPAAIVSWEPATVTQGSIFEVRASDVAFGASIDGEFAGEALHFRSEGDGRFVAMAAAPVDSVGRLPLRLVISSGASVGTPIEQSVAVAPGEYRMERLSVAPEFGSPQPPEIQRRIDDESARAMAVSRNSHLTERMWQAPFTAPREARITSGFGHGREFNGQVQSRHMGTDFQGAVGTPVLAPARGRVALVDSFYLGGNVIYIDHGAGLVTAYLHLSEQNVRVGDIVEPGRVIGRVGATGRVTGPHLHWIVRYGEVTVDGMSLLALE